MTTSTATDIVRCARHLAALGHSPGASGNLSVRVGDTMLVTATGSALSRLTEDDIAEITLDGQQLSGPRPTGEVPMHQAVYQRRPDVHAIVHLHAPMATALSCLPPGTLPGTTAASALPRITPYQPMRLGEVALTEPAPPRTTRLAETVTDVIDGRRAILLAEHGLLTVGPSIWDAADLAEELESAAIIALRLYVIPS